VLLKNAETNLDSLRACLIRVPAAPSACSNASAAIGRGLGEDVKSVQAEVNVQRPGGAVSAFVLKSGLKSASRSPHA
jgi:hypothetical protein